MVFTLCFVGFCFCKVKNIKQAVKIIFPALCIFFTNHSLYFWLSPKFLVILHIRNNHPAVAMASLNNKHISKAFRAPFRRIVVCLTLCLSLCAGMVIQFHGHYHCDHCHLIHAGYYTTASASSSHSGHPCDHACGLHPTDYDLPQYQHFYFNDFSAGLCTDAIPGESIALQPEEVLIATFNTHLISSLSEGHHIASPLRGPPCA